MIAAFAPRVTGTGCHIAVVCAITRGMVHQDWDQTVDCEALLCPLPVLRAARHLRGMAAGQVLCVRATDRMAAVDLPHFCAQAGHDYLAARQEGEVTLHLIRRGADTP